VIVKNIFQQLIGACSVLVVGGLMLTLEVRAQQAAATGPKREHSQKVIDGLQKLKEYTDANNTPMALQLLDELIKAGEPGDSFDQAQLNLYKGNLMLGLQDARPAIEPLERVFDITSRVDLLPKQDLTQAHKNLSIVYYVAMQAPGTTDAQKVTLINKSLQHLETYFSAIGEPNADEANQYASFLFTKATVGRDDDPDIASIKKAREVAEKGVNKDTRFRNDLYSLILTAHQIERNNEAVAEILELLISHAPDPATATRFWQLLPRTYLQLGNEAEDAKDTSRAREFRFRAILAYERAMQQAGLFKGEKPNEDPTIDILNLSKTYYDLGQIERGAEVMLEGLRNNRIRGEMAERAWGFSATYYQQIGKQQKAVDVLKEAAGKFPQSGGFDSQLAQTYFSMDQIDNAITAIAEAVRKGVPGKNGSLRLSQAYYLYSAEKYKEASEAAARGLALPDTDAQTRQTLTQIKDASDQYEAARQAMINN
jgi:hypothetical protein